MLSADACATVHSQASRRAERDDKLYSTINPEKKPEVFAPKAPAARAAGHSSLIQSAKAATSEGCAFARP